MSSWCESNTRVVVPTRVRRDWSTWSLLSRGVRGGSIFGCVTIKFS